MCPITHPFVMVNISWFIGSQCSSSKAFKVRIRQIAIYPGGTLLSPSDMEELYDKGHRAWVLGRWLTQWLTHVSRIIPQRVAKKFVLKAWSPEAIFYSFELNTTVHCRDKT